MPDFAEPDWSATPAEGVTEVAGICREALNREIYGGRAPSDSSALTEMRPTAGNGAGFTVETDSGTFAVEVRRVAGPR